MDEIHTQLHDLETQLIEVSGLMEALKRLSTDDSAHICVTNALEEKLKDFRQQFYAHWVSVCKKGGL